MCCVDPLKSQPTAAVHSALFSFIFLSEKVAFGLAAPDGEPQPQETALNIR
jgi:hypothetical protein